MTNDLLQAGTPIGEIPVLISYRIIELFSGGLYASPVKAIEELVANSYDANAGRVDIMMPAAMDKPDAVIWVVDDGDSMDQAGLEQLWRIAESHKAGGAKSKRPLIGMFGIGKLATFVLARQLTYVCRRDGQTLAVSMDYATLPASLNSAVAPTPVSLNVRELDDDELDDVLTPLRRLPGGDDCVDRLIAANKEEDSWTVAAMSSLTGKAQDIKDGFLEWVLSSALPNNPAFKLWLNGRPVRSSVLRKKRLAKWDVGGAPDANYPEGLKFGKDKTGRWVEVPGLPGRVYGKIELYDDVLTKGKATETGRSHGFFIVVRERLINQLDPLFGSAPLSHSTFNRFRMDVRADGLNTLLTSDREAVRETPGVALLREYMRAEFNAARAAYERLLSEQEEHTLSDRVREAGRAVTKVPLVRAIQRVLSGNINSLTLIDVPDVDGAEAKKLSSSLEESLSGDGPIVEVVPDAAGVDDFVARYDTRSRAVRYNTLHPFYGSFVADTDGLRAYEALAVAEVISEALLVEEGVSADVARRIVTRRDAFLREMAAEHRHTPSAIARNLRDQVASPDGLEQAVVEAFGSLGFSVTRLGKKNRADGLAEAIRGRRGDKLQDYRFTFDAKSTAKDNGRVKPVDIQNLDRHRRKLNAQYVAVVAPDYEGSDKPGSKLLELLEASSCRVSAFRVEDLAELVLLASRRCLGYGALEELFKDAHTPDEVHEWVEHLKREPRVEPPIKEVLETAGELAKTPNDPVTTYTIAHIVRGLGVDIDASEVRQLVEATARQVRDFIELVGDEVYLNQSVPKILEAVRRQHADIDLELIPAADAEHPATRKKALPKKPNKRVNPRTTALPSRKKG